MFRLRRFQRPQYRRLISAALTLGIFVGSLPLQLSVVPAKDLSTPYPCQKRACGCRSAEQCAKKCCCFTSAQKLAWARENGIAPTAAQQFAAQSVPASVESARCCLPNSGESPASRKTKSAGPLRVALVVTAETRQCGGLMPLWLALGDVGLPERIDWPVVTLRPAGRIETRSDAISAVNLPPLVPPPRIADMPTAPVAA